MHSAGFILFAVLIALDGAALELVSAAGPHNKKSRLRLKAGMGMPRKSNDAMQLNSVLLLAALVAALKRLQLSKEKISTSPYTAHASKLDSKLKQIDEATK